MSTHSVIEARLDQAAEECERRGTHLSELRRSVFELLLAADGPCTAYQLLECLQGTRRGAAPPTIYRTLDFLVELGLVHKVESLKAFVACLESPQQAAEVQFLICRRRGAAAELQDRVVPSALSEAAAREGFQLARAVVELDGICAHCRETP